MVTMPRTSKMPPMAGYTPVTADDTKFLRVTASYTDAEGSKGRPLLECQTRLGRPKWSRRSATWRRCLPTRTTDTDGIQIDPREVAEDADADCQRGSPCGGH